MGKFYDNNKPKLKLLLESRVLSESVKNITKEEDKRKYADQVWDMMQRSYAKVEGGFKSFTDIEDMVNDSGLWKIIVRGGTQEKEGHISAISIYKDKNGRKGVASATDGTTQGGRDYLNEIRTNDIMLMRSWGEVSGKPEEALKKKFGRDVFIPSKYAEKLTGKKIISYNEDGYHYTRLIGDSPAEKIMYGVPNVPEIADEMKSIISNLK